MRTNTAISMLGGSTESAAAWIGVVHEATRRWLRVGIAEPTRDRILAGALRKAAGDAMGIDAREWWDNEIEHSYRLEAVIVHHNAALVEFMRERLGKDPLDEYLLDQQHKRDVTLAA